MYLSVSQSDSWRQENVVFNDRFLTCLCVCVCGATVTEHGLATTPVWSKQCLLLSRGRQEVACVSHDMDAQTECLITHFVLIRHGQFSEMNHMYRVILRYNFYLYLMRVCATLTEEVVKQTLSFFLSVPLFMRRTQIKNMARCRRGDDSTAAFPNRQMEK